jgi:hypothetical protein
MKSQKDARIRQKNVVGRSLPESACGGALGREAERSAERLVALEQKLPVVLKGDAQPADNGERVQLANMAAGPKKLYAAAARLYAEALAEQPELGRDPRNGVRYDAACAAALAGCGQ